MQTLLRKFIFLAAVIQFSYMAQAETVKTAEISWQPVTKRVDGTLIKPEEISGYTLRYQRNAEAEKFIEIKPSTLFTLPNMSPGTYKFSMDVDLTDGLTSGFPTPQVVVIGSMPQAPVITIKISCQEGCTLTTSP